MIWDGDDSRNDILSDDSLEHNGKGSDDEEIADNVHQLLGQTAPARREPGDLYLYIAVLSERAWTLNRVLESVTVVTSEGGEDCVLVVWDGEGGGEVGVQVKLGGVAVELTFLFAWDVNVMITLVNFFSICSDDKTFIFSCFFACVLVRYQPVMIAENFFCMHRKLNTRSIAWIFFLQKSYHIFTVSLIVFELEFSKNYYPWIIKISRQGQ